MSKKGYSEAIELLKKEYIEKRRKEAERLHVSDDKGKRVEVSEDVLKDWTDAFNPNRVKTVGEVQRDQERLEEFREAKRQIVQKSVEAEKDDWIKDFNDKDKSIHHRMYREPETHYKKMQ